MINLIIPGEPVAKGRPRVTRTGIAYTPAKTKGYENLVKMCYMEQCNNLKLEGELQAAVIAYFQIPKSASKKKQKQMEEGEIRPTKKPDADNILKAVLDALNGLAYKDDSQIVSVGIEKWYSHEPKVEVVICEYCQRGLRTMKKWTPAEDKLLLKMKAEKKNIRQIENALKCSCNTFKKRLRELEEMEV